MLKNFLLSFKGCHKQKFMNFWANRLASYLAFGAIFTKIQKSNL